MGRATGLTPATCTVCCADDAAELFNVSGFHIVRCRLCGHRYVSPRPSREHLLEIYGESYFENPAFKTADLKNYHGYADYIADRPNIERLKSRVLTRIELNLSCGRLLDVGCGPGFFVDLAARRGWDAAGIDVNAHAIRWANDHGNARVRVAMLDDVADSEPVDCVTLFDVIEHFEDPRAELATIAKLVRPGGLLVIATPDAGSVVSRLMGRHWMEMRRAPEHLNFFDLEGLRKLLADTGFEAFEWHSIGKITTLHDLLGELRFYAPRIIGRVAGVLGELGWDGSTVDIDPRTKLCLYARRMSTPSRPAIRRPTKVTRKIFRSYDDAAPGVTPAGTSSPARSRFRAAQHRYWEARERFKDPRLPGPTAFAIPKIERIVTHVDLGPSAKILDVGAGNGTVTHHLEDRAGLVVGIDFAWNLLTRAPRRERMIQGDATMLPFADDRFDLVLEANVLHHVADPVSMLKEMARVSKRHVVLIEPNRFHPPMALFMALSKPDWRGLRFDASYVRRLAEEAGLRVVEARPQGAIYPNATPTRLIPFLHRFDKGGRFGAYVVAILQKDDP